MKVQTTKRIITNNYPTILKVGYCQIQHLLKHLEPIAYTFGPYGWNADIYDIKGYAICTGYRSFGNISPSYELCRLYDGKAQDVWSNHELTYSEKKNNVINLLNDFIERAINESIAMIENKGVD